ncbi:hypothetical protein FM106_14050 [Brachybacterium faecium]|nr:hypothetical protein FM106_14050 [Brachybacterium faecium]
MDQAYQLKEKYSSVEDFFSQITASQFETEKFLLDLSKRCGLPYKKIVLPLNFHLKTIIISNNN